MVDDAVGGEAFGLGRVVGDHAVPQHGVGGGANVLDGHVIASLQGSAGLAGQNHELHGSRAGPPADHLLDEVRAVPIDDAIAVEDDDGQGATRPVSTGPPP